MIEKFELIHSEGNLSVKVTVNGVVYEKEVTDYFESKNAFDDWIDYYLFSEFDPKETED